MHPRVAPLIYFAWAGCVEPALTPRVAPTAEPTPPSIAAPTERGPDNWKHELGWARARFPELRDFTVDVDFQPLLAWVPAGKEVTLFINVEHEKHVYHCAAASAVRTAPEHIAMMIPGPERVEAGQTVRDYVSAGAKQGGVDIFYAGGKERRRVDGSWEKIDGYATTGLDLGGRVGPVTGDTAHFRYVPVRLEASCGPMVAVPCEGFPRQCNRCEKVTIELPSPKTSRRVPPPEPSSCAQPCPKVDNPDLERLRRLAEHFPTGFLPASDPLGVALYRTLEACRRDPLWQTKPQP